MSALVGAAAIVVLVSMASGWACRALLLRKLRNNHPEEFASLGNPSTKQLASLMPRHHDLQIQFWKYLWSARVLLIKDGLVSGLAWGARISDVALAAGVVALFWSAGR